MRRFLTTLHPHLTKDGIAGFVNYFDEPNHQFLTRLLMAIDRKFLGVLQFARDWASFEALIDHTILPHVARVIYDYLGLELYVNSLPEEFSSPGKPAILMGINHEAIIEPILLVSLLDRADIRFLGMKVFQYLGPRIARHILPVLPNKIATDYQGTTRSTLANKLDPVYQLYLMEDRSTEEIKNLNQRSIDQATEHVSTGGILMLYPCGGHSIENEWYPGLGRILGGLPADLLPSIPVFPVMTTGLSRKSVYQSIHNAAFGHKRHYSVKMVILDPIFVPTYLAQDEPAELLNYVKDETLKSLEQDRYHPSAIDMKRFPSGKQLANPHAMVPINTQRQLA